MTYIKDLFQKSVKTTTLIAAFAGTVFVGCNGGGGYQFDSESEVELKTELDSASYAVGLVLANSMKDRNNWPGVNYDLLARGVFDQFAEDSTGPISYEEALKFLQEFEVSNAKRSAVEFMEENKTKEGVVSTATGLQYKVFEEGEGKQPALGDTIVFHREIYTSEGDLLFSSRRQGVPVKAELNDQDAFPGEVEALLLMKEGSDYEITIPPSLGIGEQGMQSIPPYTVLVVRLNLIEVIK